MTPQSPSPPARRPGTTERLVEAAFGAPAPLRALAARLASRRGLHAHALAAAPEDAYVLARSGFFEQAAELSKPGAVAWLGAAAGLGRIGLLQEQLTATAPLAKIDRRWIAGLAAAWDPNTALAVLGDDLPLEAAAILLAVGQDEDAGERLDGLGASPDFWLIQAALDVRLQDWPEARDDINRIFADAGLSEPLSLADGSFGLGAFAGEAGPGRTRQDEMISVIVAARDAAGTLTTAVNSLTRQTWRNLEIIIVDDGSADGTASVAAELAVDDTRIRLVESSGSLGAAGARNLGISAAQGALITFHDADDWSHPERLERQAIAALAPGAVASVAKHFRLGANGAPVSPRIFPLARLCPISLMARREGVRAAGGFETGPVGTDSEYLARLDLLFGRPSVVRIDEVHLVAGWAEASLSGSSSTGLATAEGRSLREAYERDWRVRHAERLREMVG